MIVNHEKIDLNIAMKEGLSLEKLCKALEIDNDFVDNLLHTMAGYYLNAYMSTGITDPESMYNIQLFLALLYVRGKELGWRES